MKNNNAATQLTLKSHTFSKFTAIFKHPHNFIEAINPYIDPKTGGLRRGRKGKQKLKPDWRTETRYGIRPNVLIDRFNDAAELIGLSFGTTTRYVCGDIDITSSIHPEVNEEGFKAWLGALEEIGLVRPVIVRSSYSGGLNVYFFFEEEIGTFNLACAFEGIAKDSGFKVASGELELFPNTKAYNKHYKGLKLPLQPMTGSWVLDDDYQPFTDDLDTFLRIANTTAQSQDMGLLKAACKKYGNQLRLKRCSRGKNSLRKFEADLMRAIQRGFTGFGQTNSLLLDIGCYGVVFCGLDESRGVEALASYIESTIKNLEGYETYCNHQHEIKRRCREVAKSSQAYYWSVGSDRKRNGSFVDNFNKFMADVDNGNDAKAANAVQRIEEAIAFIKKASLPIPKTASDFVTLIINTSESLFGVGVGKATLYKPTIKPIWKTAFAALLAAQVTVTSVAEAAEPVTGVAEINQPEIIDVEAENQEEVSSDNAEEFPTPEIAESPSQQGLFRPLPDSDDPELPETAENKVCSDLCLYEGFEGGAAPTSKNKKNSSPVSRPSQPLNSANNAQPAQRLQKPRPILKSERKQRLSEERDTRLASYYQQVQERHAAIKALEAQRRTPEYQKTAEEGFRAIRRILGTARAKFKRGDPSPPT